MAIIKVKIHPALGIARVGNSPDEFFIGPERPGDRSIPAGGYKDSQCRVKRQAAQFRIFAYHDDGKVKEVTEKEAGISWTVHLANKKASVKKMDHVTDRNPPLKPGDPPIDPKDLIIDPGPRTLSGPDNRQIFDTGQIRLPGAEPVSIPLGEARTDKFGRLLILGGFGHSASPTSPPHKITGYYDNSGWYDDVSDGKITATIQIRGSGETFIADGAWVVVAPPKFAPGIDNVVTLYDLLFDLAVSKGWIKEPATTSYTQDIYPILQRARTSKWVQKSPLGPHSWPEPVIDLASRYSIFFRLANEGGDMPLLYNASMTGSQPLTETQFKHFKRWKEGSFENDWKPPPPPDPAAPHPPPSELTPEGMDKAALENAVGAAFFPGIEVGGITRCPISEASNYVTPFRLNHKLLNSGDLTAYMALPWQADFMACGGWEGTWPPSQSWWPVPRPINVIPQGEANYKAWTRDLGSYQDMINYWHTLGFIVKQGDQYVEVDRCPRPFVTLVTPSVSFRDVSRGPMGTGMTTASPIIFEIKSTEGKVTLELKLEPRHPQFTCLNMSVNAGPSSGDNIVTAKLWLKYQTGTVGEELNDQVVIRNLTTDQTWTVSIIGNTVSYKPAAITIALDRSESMSEKVGGTQSKYKYLQEALSIFVDTVLEGSGISLVSFNENVQLLQDLTSVGSFKDNFDHSRTTIRTKLEQQHEPIGASSIGAGLLQGYNILNTGKAKSSYGTKAIVVLTDGKENRYPWIADVVGKINRQQVYSVFLGFGPNSNAPALQALSRNSGGYSLTTEDVNKEDEFKLGKYLLQILASINKSQIVLSSDGDLLSELEHRIPFNLTESDNAIDVILLSRSQKRVNFRLQTPNGFIIEQSTLGTNLTFVSSKYVSYYRIVLPVELRPMRIERTGTWHVLLNEKRTHRTFNAESSSTVENSNMLDRDSYNNIELSSNITERYSLSVHVYSNLTFKPTLQQENHEPGSVMSINAIIYESGVPFYNETVNVWAEIIMPDYSHRKLGFKGDNGQFGASFRSTIPGIYQFRIRVCGRSRLGYPFQREQILTGEVWHGGDHNRDTDKPEIITRLMREQD